MRRFIGASTTKGAVSPSQRKPAMKVCVFSRRTRSVRPAMPKRGFGAKTLAPRAAAAQARHLRGGSSLVQENQSVRFKPHLRLPHNRPFFARLSDVGAILFAGHQRFFEAIAVADQPTRERGGIGPNANGMLKRARQLRHGDVLLLGHAAQKKLTMRIKLGVPGARHWV
jgi:hypothetical protein